MVSRFHYALMIMNAKSTVSPLFRALALCRVAASLVFAVTCAALLAGCVFNRNYYVDPKPARVSFDDLPVVKSPQPVHLVFDVYNENGPFPQATQKLAPKVLEVVTFSGLFSSVAKVGSDNMANLQIVITETPLPGPGEPATQPLPQGVTLDLPGTAGGIVYTFTGTYTPAGKPAVKKTYNHAIHVATPSGPRPSGAKKMRAMGAVDEIVEQMTLSFLRDLHNAGAL